MRVYFSAVALLCSSLFLSAITAQGYTNNHSANAVNKKNRNEKNVSQDSRPILTNAILNLAREVGLNVIFENRLAISNLPMRIDTPSADGNKLQTIRTIMQANNLSYAQIDRRTILIFSKYRAMDPIISLEDLLARADILDEKLGPNSPAARKFELHDYDFQAAPVSVVMKTLAGQENLNVIFDTNIAALADSKKINYQVKNISAPRALKLLIDKLRFLYVQLDSRTILITPAAITNYAFSSNLEELITRAEEDDTYQIDKLIKETKTKKIPASTTPIIEDTLGNLIRKWAASERLNVMFINTDKVNIEAYPVKVTLAGVSPLRSINLMMDAYRLNFAQVDQRSIMIYQNNEYFNPSITLTELIDNANKIEQSGLTNNKLQTAKADKEQLSDYNFENVSVASILKTIADQLRLNIIYEDSINMLAESKKINFQLKKVRPAQAINNLLNAQRFIYNHVDQRTIYIRPAAYVHYQFSNSLDEIIARADLNERLSNLSSVGSSAVNRSSDAIDFKAENQPLTSVIGKLAKLSNIDVQYSSDLAEQLAKRMVTIKFQNINPVKLLQIVCDAHQLKYFQTDRRAITIENQSIRLQFYPTSLTELVNADTANNQVELKSYDFNFQDAPIAVAIKTIAEKEGLNIIFEDSIAKLAETTKFDFQGLSTTVPAALSQIFISQRFCFSQIDRNTILIAPDSPANCVQHDTLDKIIIRYHEQGR